MRWARIGLGVIAGCLLLTTGLVLVNQQPDDVTRVLRRHGRFSWKYIEPLSRRSRSPDMISSGSMVPGATAEATGVYRDLVSAGWRPKRDRTGVLLTKNGPRDVYIYIVDPVNGRAWAHYHRPATPAEHRLHAIKKFLGIED
jgi:hypothetical protein